MHNWRLLLLHIIPLILVSCQLASPTSPSPPEETPPSELVTASFNSTPGPATAGGFTFFADHVRESPRNERQGIVSQYMAQIGSTPLIDNNEVIFLYRGGGYEVQLVGDMNNWNMEAGANLIQLEGTDLWYLKAAYELSARLDYQFLIDRQTMNLDSNNPNQMAGPLGPNSVIEMPDYQKPVELLPAGEQIPSGTLTTHTIDSQYLNQTKTFVVYAPAGQIVGKQLPSVYINDGHDFLNLINGPILLDRLIAMRIIPPVAAVFVLPINRKVEYSLNDSYAQFLTNELVPFIQTLYETDSNPQRTAILGKGIGANAALYTAAKRPDVFGLVSAMSPAVIPGRDPLKAALSNINHSSSPEDGGVHIIRTYMEVGTYETDVEFNDTRINTLVGSRQLAQVLRIGGTNLTYEERPEGHSWGLWQAAFGRSLANLLNR